MLDRKAIERFGGWEGYRVERIAWPEGDSRTVTIYLKPSSRTMYCTHCGSRCRQVHETTVRRVRDLPLLAFRVALVVPRRRVWCVKCGGPRLEKLSWLGRYQRVTDRLAEAVSQLLVSSNILAVARFFQLGWHTVKALDKARLRQTMQEPDWSQIHYLAMDEFALHKGYRYATVVVDPISRQVLWVGNGRSRETARAFFEQLPAGVAEQTRAVAIDMTTAYELEIKANCPNAEVVYDLFHVVAKYGREVIRPGAGRASQPVAPRQACPPGDQIQPLAVAAQSRKPGSAAVGEAGRAAESQPATAHRLPHARRAQATVVLPPPLLRQEGLGSLVGAGPRQRNPCTGPLRDEAQGLPARDPVPLPPPAQHQHRRRHQQHHQGDQATGLRLPRSGVLLPEDPRSLPRNSAMNLFLCRTSRPALGWRPAYTGSFANRKGLTAQWTASRQQTPIPPRPAAVSGQPIGSRVR